MPKDLTAALHAREVEAPDLLQVMQSHFGGARWEGGQAIFMPSHGEPQLSVDFDREGRVRSVVSADSMNSDTQAKLEQLVAEKLLQTLPAQVRHAVLFATSPVRGAYRAPDDSFQISPVPLGSPQPEVLIADHPFILSYYVIPSGDAMVTSSRVQRGQQEWAWFLNAVLFDRIGGLGRYSEHHWVLCGRDFAQPAAGQVTWAQEFYALPEDAGLPFDAYPEPSPEMSRTENSAYYTQRGIGGDDLTVPELLDNAVTALGSLDPASRDRFLRAAQWLDAASRMWTFHHGAGLGALVSAVETLGWATPPPEDRCPECGKDRNPGPTARFKHFVDRYTAGSAPVKPADVYTRRSQLYHGAERSAMDEPGFGAFSPAHLESRQEWEGVAKLVQAVLINWLLDTARAS